MPRCDNSIREVTTPRSRSAPQQKKCPSDLDPPLPIEDIELPSTQMTSTRILSSQDMESVFFVPTAKDDDSGGMDMSNLTVVAEALIRQRRRVQQRKYRLKQRNYFGDLEKDVKKLRQEIRRLEQEVQFISMGISGEQTVWSAASDYFRLFRHGFRSLPNDICSYVLNALESSMSPDVSDGPVSGPKAILTRWMKFSLCFDDIRMDLQRLENGPVGNSVVATVITSFTISSDSLSLVFPNLIKETPANESSSSAKSLSGKLLHQRLVVRGSILFEWDETTNRINKMRSQSDMLTPLLRLLGSLEEVSRVFEGALVSPGCSWPRCIV